jgi:phage tail-like protein
VAIHEGLLVIEFDGDVVRTVPLAFTLLRIGRAPDNDLSLQHPRISRYHAEINMTPDGLVVTDLGSANGTWVQGARLLPHQPTRVDPGRVLRMGPFQLVIRQSSADQPGWAEPALPDGDGRTHSRLGSLPDALDTPQEVEPAPRRPTLPVPPPVVRASRYLDYLPAMFADNDFMGRFLLIFESLWEPMEQRQDHIGMYVDPATCPASFLPWIASWFDLPVGAHWPETRIRDLLGQVSDLYRWRGTTYGMAQMIEI